jgi:DNA-binding transcriptional ArsR family regulator
MDFPTRAKTQKNFDANAALHKALSHPLRYAVLVVLSEKEASPKELSEELGEPFMRVCEHVRLLKDWGYIELVKTHNRRGGTQHFYRAVRRPVFDAAEWQKIPFLARIRTTNSIIRGIISDIAASIKSGRFDAHPRRALLRMSITVDDEGFAEADESALNHLAELGRIEARSAARLAQSGEAGRYLRTATLVFEAGPTDSD